MPGSSLPRRALPDCPSPRRRLSCQYPHGHLDYDGHTRLRRVHGHQLSTRSLAWTLPVSFDKQKMLIKPPALSNISLGSSLSSVYPPGGPGVSTFQQGWKLVDHTMYSTTTMPVCSWPYNLLHPITEGRLQVALFSVITYHLITTFPETPCQVPQKPFQQ